MGLVSIIIEKLPEELNLIINCKLNEDGFWEIKDVFNILKSEFRAREHIYSSSSYTLPFTASTFHSSTFHSSTFHSSTFHSSTFHSSTFHSSNNPNSKYDKKAYIYKRNDAYSPVCLFCDNNHKSHQCKLVTNITTRKKILSDKKCCFRFLSNKHFSNKCSSKFKCFKCNRFHHVSICDSDNRDEHNNNKDGELTSVASTSYLSASNSVLQLNETLSYVTPKTSAKLNLKRVDSKEINIKTFGHGSISEVLDRVRVSIKSIDGYFISVECFVKDICSPLSANFYWKFMENSIIMGVTGPVATKSKLGHLISGPMIVNRDQIDNSTVLSSHVLKIASDFNREQILIKNDLNLLWDDSKISESHKIVYENLQKNIKFNDAMYEVKLSFKIDHPLIGDNYNLCKSRFLALEKKLPSNRDLFASYNNIIKDQLSKGIIEKVSNFESNIGDVHYLPHRPVIREDKLTSKVCIVFDASACTSGPSLNDCLFSGPSLATSLHSILLRFRAKRIALIADIEKAFLNITLAEKHRDFVRFIWYKDLFDLDNNLKNSDLSVYRLCQVLFGVTSSPFLLSATLVNHAKHYAANDFDFSKKLIQSLHVDDLNASFDSVSKGISFYNKAKSCLREASFYLRKFESKSTELNSLFKEDDQTSSDITKVPGLKWDKIEDNFIFPCQDLSYFLDNKPTKRSFLRFIASFYDPLGLVNPIIVNNVNKKYEAFVQKRLEKICSLYDINFWSYIESERNSAVFIFRGCKFSTFQNNDLWFKGPSFLFNDLILRPSFDLSKRGDSL
ncbi:uncharacterized protein LOC136087106 [Hydra vulgaris]|uniref:Uncharacterized protein LOC136087106 n=1 Tax=Hydra vulgaris TaxID=6087 RepID=A0ABM4CUR0_HYDVU